MSTKKKPSKDQPSGPTKTDLFKVLDSLLEARSPALDKLWKKVEATKAEFDEFITKDPTYKKLYKAKEEASGEYYHARRAEADVRRTKTMRVRQHILTRGCTPAVIAEVEALVAEYSEFESRNLS